MGTHTISEISKKDISLNHVECEYCMEMHHYSQTNGRYYCTSEHKASIACSECTNLLFNIDACKKCKSGNKFA